MRRVARERRLAAKQTAIDAARNQMQTREAAAEAEKAQKVGGMFRLQWFQGRHSHVSTPQCSCHSASLSAAAGEVECVMRCVCTLHR